MSSENEMDVLYENADTVEEKRRKNVLDNEQFLQSLQLFHVRDDLKSTVHSVTNGKKPARKKIIDESEMRRSSRIQSMARSNYNDQSTLDNEDYLLSTDESSNDEEEDDLTSAFTAKIDKDWQPVHFDKPSTKTTRPIRKTAKTVSGGVKIFFPNTGLKASTVASKDNSQKCHVSIKMNIAISSSSEED